MTDTTAITTTAIDSFLSHTWTESDLGRLPDGYRYEIIDGRPLITPPPGEDHQNRCARAFTTLADAAPPGWRIRWHIGLAHGDDRYIPDLVGLAPDTPRAEDGYNHLTPTLVVEVESQSTRAVDRVEKAEAYAAAGIPTYWLIERTGRMTVLELDEDGTYHVGAEIKPGTTMRLERPYPAEVSVPAA